MKKVLSFILALCLIFGMLPIAAFAYEDENGNEGGVTLDKEDAYPAIRDAFADYLVNTVHIEADDYLGIPVDLYVYAKVGRGDEVAPVLQYVINTNTERVGTESDVSILSDLIEEYIVVVVDYRNNSLTTAVNTDQSVHRIQLMTVQGTHLNYTDESGTTKKLNILTSADNWILPAGYRIMRDVVYFNYKENGVEGTLDRIVQVWNEDFSDTTHKNVLISWGQKTTEDGTLVYNDAEGVRCFENADGDGYVYEDGTAVEGDVVPEYKKLREGSSYYDESARTAYVKDTWAEDWWDCVKKDGTPVDLNLYLDIMYPASPAEGVEVPVLSMAVSRQSTTGNWYADSQNPEYIGAAMFSGYAGLLYEYGYVPMARRDHYGYFTDSPNYAGTTSTDWKYGLSKWNGVRASCAAIRTFRYMCATEDALDALTADSIGLICISKTGYNVFLGNENPEDFAESNVFSETQDTSQPQPYETYDDGTPIPSGVQAVYTVSGSNPNNMTYGFCPVYVSVGMQDSGAYRDFYKKVRLNAKMLDIESVHYSLPELGHAYLVGMCEEYNVDTYLSVLNFFDYHVAGKNAVVEYITPLNGSTNVGTTDPITVKFNASVSLETVKKRVQIVNAKTGEAATGSWSSLYGNTEWTFTPDGLTGGQTYLVYVPEDTLTEDGRALKSSKTAAFMTAPEELSVSGTVASGDGTTTVTNGNNVYILFDTPDTSDSTGEVLRFTVTNERAAQTLSVYVLSSVDEENIASSTLGEKLGSVAIAGAGAYELDISDYLSGLAEDECPAFALVAERTVGTTTLHEETYDTESDTSTLVSNNSSSLKITWSDLYDANGNGGGALAVNKTGSTYYFKNAIGFGNNATSGYISESDFGRLFRIRMSVLAPEATTWPHYFNAYIGYNTPETLGVNQYVDWNDITNCVVHPTFAPGEWLEIDFYYLIDDLYYTSEEIQKGYLVTTHDLGLIYLDNYIVEEIVTEAVLSDAVLPSIVTHPSVELDTTLLDAIVLASGESGDVFFGDSSDLIVSGQSVNTSANGAEKVYLKLDLSQLDTVKPALLTLNVTESRYGEIAIYGVTDTELGASWSADTISWQNAPANDRFGFGVDSSVTTLIQTVEISGVGAYTVDVSDFTTGMKDAGASEATLIAVLSCDPRQLLLSCDFEAGNATAVSPAASGGPVVTTVTSDVAYPDGGTYCYYVLADSTYSRIRFKVVDTVTASDVGQRYTVKYNFMSTDGGTYMQCIRRDTTQLQSETVTAPAGEWIESTYSFTVTEEMVGYIPYFTLVSTGLGALSNTEGAETSAFYVDNIRLYDGTGDISFEINAESETPILSADFDTVAPTKTGSGGVSSTIGAASTGIAYSGTKTLYWTATNAFHRPMLQLFSSLSEDMIGKQYKITYMFYATAAGSYNNYPRTVVDGSAKEFRTDEADPINMTYAEANTWQQMTTVFTITEAMVELGGDIRIAFEPSAGLVNSENSSVDIYIDDLKMYEVTEESDTEVLPYTYENGYESGTVSGTLSGFEYAAHGSTASISTDYDRTGSGTHSYKILANRSYNRVCMYKIIDSIGYDTTNLQSWAEGATESCLTEDDIGRKFRISFYMKSEIDGQFDLFIGNHKAKIICTERKSYSIVGDGSWTKFTYEFEVNQSMVDNRIAILVIALSDFSYSSDGDTLRTLYIDDFRSVEVIDGYGTPVTVTESATVSNRTAQSELTGLTVDREASHEATYDGINATLYRFEKDSYIYSTLAKLSIGVLQGNGQELSLWGLTFDPGEEPTFNSISALNADGTVNTSAVFGGKPLATFNASVGVTTVDILEYVRSRDGEDLLLLVTSEESGTTEYLNLNFDTRTCAIGEDVTGEGEISIANGVLSTDSTSITFHNLLDYEGTPFSVGTTYTFSASVLSDSERTFTLSLDGKTAYKNKTLQNGELSFTFTVTEENINSLTLTASEAGFGVDNVKLTFNGGNVILQEATLALCVADVTCDISILSGVRANMTLTEDATLSLYLPEELTDSLSQLFVNGDELDIDSLPLDGECRKLSITGISIKDLAAYHTITLVYASGVVRHVDVSALDYLSKLIVDDAADLTTRKLVYSMISYAMSAESYFLGESAPHYRIAYEAMLTEYERYSFAHELTPESYEVGTIENVISAATVNLAEAPEYLFLLSDSFTGTLTLTCGTQTVSYEVTGGLADGESIVVFRPEGVFAAADAVLITASGTHSAEGTYGLGNYRGVAAAQGLDGVVETVDALYTYILAVKAYEASLT